MPACKLLREGVRFNSSGAGSFYHWKGSYVPRADGLKQVWEFRGTLPLWLVILLFCRGGPNLQMGKAV